MIKELLDKVSYEAVCDWVERYHRAFGNKFWLRIDAPEPGMRGDFFLSNVPADVLELIPTVPGLYTRIKNVIGPGGGGALDMDDWHKCDTTHCVAGWAVVMAGAPGGGLEHVTTPAWAGALIFAKTYPNEELPDFYATNDAARAWITEQAEKESHRHE